ncbi:MAG TPA: ATP-binding protein [Candidatus Angelobacter sp.]|nr:ATP-binding protein [Candidatus Angelobacter sp.]
MSTPPQTKAECPICDGTGWKIVEVPGKASRSSRCDCRVENRNLRLLRQARIPARYEHCTLADFNDAFDGAHRSLASARLAAGRFVEEYPLEKTGILFTGRIGVGKTHLAVGVIRELILGKGVPCLFYDYRELLKEIQNSYNPSVQTTELEILRPVFEAEVLVLDELGAVRPTEWVWDTVSYVVNYRYNEKKTTIITTNLADLSSRSAQPEEAPSHRTSRPRELAAGAHREDTLGDRITDRMRSRLHEMCRVIAMDGIDFRLGPKRIHK